MATAAPFLGKNRNLTVQIASGEDLDVREFRVDEAISTLFSVRLFVVASNADVDFEGAIGKPARFEVHDASSWSGETRHWSGVCSHIEQIGVEQDGLSSYELTIVPRLWLATQRRNYRVFQDQSELDIALAVLADWGITPRLELSASSYEKRRYRTQYAESDHDFISRMLEDIGVAYTFEQADGDTRLVLVDAPNKRSPRAPIRFVATPSRQLTHEYVTSVRTQRSVRPGRYTQSDVDYRKALDYPLSASAQKGGSVEAMLERYHHNYGSFLWKGGGGDTPVADDRGAARTNEGLGQEQVRRRVEAQRVKARGATMRTNAHDLTAGQVIVVVGHPRAEIGAPQLIVSCTFSGSATGDWAHACSTVYTDVDYRPELTTPKPRTRGVESATVTGPAGEEIHTDEFGRVRVKFHWDREGAADETSSCWIPVSQPWAGAGFGAISLPRVGQEVLIDFLGADPDRPIVLGRVFTTTTPPPYELPKFKMVSGLRSESYPKPKKSGGARMGGGPAGEAASALEPIAPGASTVACANDVGPAAPLGGGPAPLGLGGVGDAPATGGAPNLKEIMPGIFGNDQAPQADLDDAVSRMRAPGPDGEDAKRSANGLVTDDTANAEKLYLQGQKDLRIAVKNNLVGGVGANRAFTVLRNDYEGIVGYQATKVGKDRTIEVTGVQRHTVVGDIVVDAKANQVLQTKQDFSSVCLEGGHRFESKKSIILAVDDKAFVILTPAAILIDAPKVYINPGNVVMQAVAAGADPEAAVAAAQSQDRVDEASRKMTEFLRSRGMDNNPISKDAVSRAANGEISNDTRGMRELAKHSGATNDAEVLRTLQQVNGNLNPPAGRPF